jgi:integrase
MLHRESLIRSQKTERETTKTFKWCAERYIADQGEGWKNAKHRQQWQNTPVTYAYPVIGKFPVNEITKDNIVEIISPIWLTKTETASRVRGRLGRILEWAKYNQYRDGPNPAAWKENLEYQLPPKTQVQIVKHHPAMKFDDVGKFMIELRQQTSISAKALELLILTAARTSEVIEAKREEIDTSRSIWNIPAEHMKMRVSDNVPLCEDALILIKSLPIIDGNPYLFPGQRRNRPLSNMAILKLLKRMGHDNVTAHGFRSTFRDWAAEHTNFSRNIPELCLAHGPKDKVEAAYLRTKLLPKRKELLQAWANYCDVIPSDGNNITLSQPKFI